MHLRVVTSIVLGVLFTAGTIEAADKTHQQMMAEIRMLQEQQQQLAQMLGGLAETLKTVTIRMDDQTNATRKAFADQKLLVDGIAEGVRILREKADDTNVRLSSMSQELESHREIISSLPTSPAPSSGVPPIGDPGAAPPQSPERPPAPNVAPQKAYDAAFNDYTGGQYDLAIEGFNLYLKTYPKSDRADDAQLNIGNSYYNLGNFKDAVTAFQRVISDYPQTDSVPSAYYKLGLSYESLKQPDLARRAYEAVVKNHPNAMDAQLAKQRLDSLSRR